MRWFFGDQTPFFSKGRGRSLMISDFLVMHPSGPFFTLDSDEYKHAIEVYPDLRTADDINYIEQSATGLIDVGYDSYFDNTTILCQFERLFKMLRFKKQFQNHEIEIIVDNATTHTAKPYSLTDFGKSIDTRCPVDTIEYIDTDGVVQTIDCYFKTGPFKGLSKGLLHIAKEFNLKLPSNVKLNELRDILSNHPAFKTVTLSINA